MFSRYVIQWKRSSGDWDLLDKQFFWLRSAGRYCGRVAVDPGSVRHFRVVRKKDGKLMMDCQKPSKLNQVFIPVAERNW